jgi:hypothetical protein
MKQILSIALLLLSSALLFAQNRTQSQDDSNASGNGSATSVQGCLSGTDGNYTLTDKQGTSYQLIGDSSKLAEHVGHEIRVTGIASSASSNDTSGTSATGATSGESGTQTLRVSSLKHISKTCEKSNGMSH